MTDHAGLIANFDESRFRRVRRLALVATLVLTVMFTAAVVLFARFGGGFVDSLGGRVGEIVAARAKSLAESGQLEPAAKLYAQAVQAKFDDPQQRVWCYRRYGETLMDLQRWPEAAEAFRGALALDAKEWPSHHYLCEALKKVGQIEPMRQAAQNWLDQATGDPVQTKMANEYLRPLP